MLAGHEATVVTTYGMGEVVIVIVAICWMTQTVIHSLDLVESCITASTIVGAENRRAIDGHTDLTLWGISSFVQIKEHRYFWNAEIDVLLRDD